MEHAATSVGGVWFYDDRGTRSLGKAEAELIELIHQKKLISDEMVWTKGMVS